MGIDADFRFSIPQDADFPDDITAERDSGETRIYVHPGIFAETEKELKAALDGQDQYREQCRALSAEIEQLTDDASSWHTKYLRESLERERLSAENRAVLELLDRAASDRSYSGDLIDDVRDILDPASTQQDLPDLDPDGKLKAQDDYYSELHGLNPASTQQEPECEHRWQKGEHERMGTVWHCLRCENVTQTDPAAARQNCEHEWTETFQGPYCYKCGGNK